MKRILSVLILCTIVVACGNNQTNDVEIIELRDYKHLPLEKKLLADISESIRMIRLDTSDSTLVSLLMDIKLEVDKIYLRALNGVFVFDLSGRFLNTIGTRGRGPTEYLSLYGIFPEKEHVWLLDGSRQVALKFTDSGRFLESIELGLGYGKFSEFFYAFDGLFICFMPDQGQPKTDIMLAFFDSNGLLDSVLYRNPISGDALQRFVYSEVGLIHYGDQVKLKHLFNDTIYNVLNNKLYPATVLELGMGRANEHARQDAANQDDSFYLFQGMDIVRLCGESSRYVYLHIANERPPHNVIFYDKKEQKVHRYEFMLPDDERIDQEKAKNFVPKYIDKNGYLIGETAPANEDDNPVIVIAKLRR